MPFLATRHHFGCKTTDEPPTRIRKGSGAVKSPCETNNSNTLHTMQEIDGA